MARSILDFNLVQPHNKAGTPEPTLRMLVYRYYADHFDEQQAITYAEEFCERITAALAAGKAVSDAMKRPLYATEEGGKRIDVVARAICQSRNFAGCDGVCTAGCTGSNGTLLHNGCFDAACAAVNALDRYDAALTAGER